LDFIIQLWPAVYLPLSPLHMLFSHPLHAVGGWPLWFSGGDHHAGWDDSCMIYKNYWNYVTLLGIVIMKHHSYSSEFNCMLALVWCESIQCTAASVICQVACRSALKTLWW